MQADEQRFQLLHLGQELPAIDTLYGDEDDQKTKRRRLQAPHSGIAGNYKLPNLPFKHLATEDNNYGSLLVIVVVFRIFVLESPSIAAVADLLKETKPGRQSFLFNVICQAAFMQTLSANEIEETLLSTIRHHAESEHFKYVFFCEFPLSREILSLCYL